MRFERCDKFLNHVDRRQQLLLRDVNRWREPVSQCIAWRKHLDFPLTGKEGQREALPCFSIMDVTKVGDLAVMLARVSGERDLLQQIKVRWTLPPIQVERVPKAVPITGNEAMFEMPFFLDKKLRPPY